MKNAALSQFIAKSIIDQQLAQAQHGFRSPEGAVVAQVVNATADFRDLSILQFWRYSQEQLAAIDAEAFFKAFLGDLTVRPAFSYFFAIDTETINRALIDVHTVYDRGYIAESRGGYAQRWIVEKHGNSWRILDITTYQFDD